MAVRTKDSAGTTGSQSIQAPELADAALGAGIFLLNGTLVPSVGSSALTITLKTKAGATPSVTDPVLIVFRSATAATGDYTVLRVTAALSLVVSSGSTLGTANATAFRLWVVAFNDAGTVRLGVVNTLSGTNIMALTGWGIADSTAEGGAGAADSAQVIYTGTAVSAKAYSVLGYLSYESGLATAGTWSGTPTRTQLLERTTPLPGQVIQQVISATGSMATGTTAIPTDNTIPQITEGDQFMSQAITPTSAANLLLIDVATSLANTGTPVALVAALFQDATANALKVSTQTEAGASGFNTLPLTHQMLAATTSATTFRVRAGANSGTTTFNGSAGASFFGGTIDSHLAISEVMR
jgi:hypothetical protein